MMDNVSGSKPGSRSIFQSKLTICVNQRLAAFVWPPLVQLFDQLSSVEDLEYPISCVRV